MMKQLFCTLSLSRIFTQAAINEIHQIIATFSQLRRVSIHNALHGQVVFHSQKWRLALNQFNGNHAQRPNIYFFIIWFFFNQLWRHPCWSANQRLSAENFLCKLDCESKICNFDLSSQAQEDIVAFQVTMKLSSAMKAFQALEHALENVSNDIFWNFLEVVINEVNHCSAVHELNKHKKGLLVVICKEVFGEMVGVAQIHYSDFRPYFIQSSIVFELYYSASVVFSIFLLAVVCKKYLTHCTLSKFLLKDKLTRWISLNEINFLYHAFELFSGQQFGLDVTLLQ